MGTTRTVQIDVDDGDGGMATQTWSLVVIADHAPSEPTLLYPTTDLPLLIAGLHFAIGNASDLDGDPIAYEIELASDPDFVTDAQTSGVLAGTPTGITAWSPDEGALHVGRWYWRASASDGQVESRSAAVSFLLVPDPSTFPDAAAADAGPGMPPDAPRNCGCGIVGARSDFAPVLAIFAWIALSVVRRAGRR
jgi:hypothetical protein